MNTSDDLRAHLEAEYQKAVKLARLPPNEESALLASDTVATLSDDDLRGLIRTHTRLESGLFSGDEDEERTWFDKYLRYVVSASAPLGAFVFLYYARLYDEQAHRELKHTVINKPPDELLIMSGRVTWGVTHALFYAAVCATIFFGLCYIIPTALRRRPFRVKVWALVLTLLFASAIGLFSDKFHNHLRVPEALLKETVNKDEGWKLERKCFPFYELKPMIQCKMETGERWLYFTHAFLVSLCIIIICAVAKDSQDVTQLKCGFDRMERRLRLNMKLLRLVLYLGAAVLITEIASAGALLNWPLTYLKSRSADRLVSALITERAINYTVFLALLYVPAFLIFRDDAYRFARLRYPDKSLAEQEEWLSSQGIGVSTWRYVPRVVAILGPLLSQPILEWIRHFLG
jgi:hypothetical protein